MFSLPVFLPPLSKRTGGSVTSVSSVMTIGFLAMAFASMAWGTLTDRIGPRLVLLIGSILLAGSLALASRHVGHRVPGPLPADPRRRERRDLRAHDGVRHRLVRH